MYTNLLLLRTTCTVVRTNFFPSLPSLTYYPKKSAILTKTKKTHLPHLQCFASKFTEDKKMSSIVVLESLPPDIICTTPC